MPKGSRFLSSFSTAVAPILQCILLSGSYSLSVVKLDKSVEATIAGLRMQWLDFCETPVPESNKVIMQISSAVYELLLEKSEDFQRGLNST